MKRLLLLASLIFASGDSLTAAIPGSESLAKLIAAEFDTNSDDILDQGEWQSGIAASFGKLDSNNDGSVKPDEVDGMQEDISKETGDVGGVIIVALIKQVLLSLDSDGDNAVSRKEYDTLADKVFEKLNADKGAGLTIAELSELPTKLIVR